MTRLARQIPHLEIRRGELAIHNPQTNAIVEVRSSHDPSNLRGDGLDLAVMDEAAFHAPTVWRDVVRPALADRRGRAIFASTPNGKNWYYDLYQAAERDGWARYQLPTSTNPHISPQEIDAMRAELPARTFAQEIDAQFADSAVGALWTAEMIDAGRVSAAPEYLANIVVAIDPHATTGMTGIVVAGVDARGHHAYILDDASVGGTPSAWAHAAVDAYRGWRADKIVYEANQGGDMVAHVLQSVIGGLPIEPVWASRGKRTRAEPISVLYAQGRVHHVGSHPYLEKELVFWEPGGAVVDDSTGTAQYSPNRLDALVWAVTCLLIEPGLGGKIEQHREKYDDEDD